MRSLQELHDGDRGRGAARATCGGQPAARPTRVLAPFGRRRCEVVANEASGGYRIITALDGDGPVPRPGQFYMLATERGWGGDGERPFLPRAFSVAERRAGRGGVRLAFLLEDVGPGTERLAALAPGDGL